MHRLFALFTLLCLALVATVAQADPRKLTGAEIKQLFVDKTVHGAWAGTEYWSYFGPDGWTVYKSKDSPHQDGRWGANASQYCSKWATGSESCYNIYQDGSTIIWEDPQGGQRYRSELLPGKQVPAD